MTPKFHSLQIKNIRKETKSCVSISFDLPKELQADYQYLSGQYLTLRSTIQGEDVRRSYSLCSAPSDQEWRVAIKQVENGVFSTFALHELKEGDFLDVMNPMGNFKLETSPENEKSYVLFAAGSGVTPIFSIAKSILREEPMSHVTMFYGNQGFSEVIFREELENLKNEYLDRFCLVHLFSRENIGNAIQKGRIDEQKCLDLHKAFLQNEQIDDVFICGPEQMTQEVSATLIKLGVEKSQIKTELFGTNVVTKNRLVDTARVHTDSHCDVTVVLDGRQFTFSMEKDKQSVLEAGLSQGLDLRYSCKGGVCSTCRCKVTEGKVDMDMNYALEDYEIARGFVLSCQSFPATNTLTIDFDQEN
jgi:ring-1,2-phenylacetyl-CoA epoxidase subunit PaaE